MEKEIKIMVVDDDQKMARTLCDILTLEGFQAETSLSGEEAISKLESSRPDCILMDIRMPGMDGIATLRLIRERSPEIPVLLMSAFASEKQLKAAETGGAVMVLQKPLDIDSLIRILSRFGTEESRIWKNMAF